MSGRYLQSKLGYAALFFSRVEISDQDGNSFPFLFPFFSISAGASTCSLCPSSQTSTLASSIVCAPCPDGMQCLLGTPFAVPVQSTEIKVINPFSTTNVQNQNTITTTNIIVAFIFFPPIALILVLGIMAEKSSVLKAKLATCSGRLTGFDWSQLDLFFSEVHYAYLYKGKLTPIRQTGFGAAISISCIFAIVAVATILGISNVRYPIYSSSINPQAPPWQPAGVFQLTVRVLGGGISSCANGSANGFGIYHKSSDWSGTPTTAPNSFSATDGSCTLQWTCAGMCAMNAASAATLQLKSPPRAWASYVWYSLSTPVFASKTTAVDDFGTVPFQVSGGLYSPSDGTPQNFTAFRGSGATNISLTLTPMIVNNTNGVTSAVAFEPSVTGVQPGDVTTRDAFNFNSADGFSVNFVLQRNTISLVKCVVVCVLCFFPFFLFSFFRFTHRDCRLFATRLALVASSAASTAALVNFLILLSSLFGTIIGAFTLGIKQIEKFFEFTPANQGGGAGDAVQVGADGKQAVELDMVSGVKHAEVEESSATASGLNPLTLSNANVDVKALETRVAVMQQQQIEILRKLDALFKVRESDASSTTPASLARQPLATQGVNGHEAAKPTQSVADHVRLDQETWHSNSALFRAPESESADASATPPAPPPPPESISTGLALKTSSTNVLLNTAPQSPPPSSVIAEHPPPAQANKSPPPPARYTSISASSAQSTGASLPSDIIPDPSPPLQRAATSVLTASSTRALRVSRPTPPPPPPPPRLPRPPPT